MVVYTIGYQNRVPFKQKRSDKNQLIRIYWPNEPLNFLNKN